jgi:hypothetical protein
MQGIDVSRFKSFFNKFWREWAAWISLIGMIAWLGAGLFHQLAIIPQPVYVLIVIVGLIWASFGIDRRNLELEFEVKERHIGFVGRTRDQDWCIVNNSGKFSLNLNAIQVVVDLDINNSDPEQLSAKFEFDSIICDNLKASEGFIDPADVELTISPSNPVRLTSIGIEPVRIRAKIPFTVPDEEEGFRYFGSLNEVNVKLMIIAGRERNLLPIKWSGGEICQKIEDKLVEVANQTASRDRVTRELFQELLRTSKLLWKVAQ